MELYEASTLAEFVSLLKAEQGDSYSTLAAKAGIAAATLHRLVAGNNADDSTLDKLSQYAGVKREWLYALAKGTEVRPRYSRTVSMLAALLEEAPPDIAEMMLIQARALVAARKKQSAKIQQQNDDLPVGQSG